MNQDDIITSVEGDVTPDVRPDHKLSLSSMIKRPCESCGHGATRVSITLPTELLALRPERIVITTNDPAEWVVEDILIGNRSQLSQAGGIPGDMFQPETIDSFVSFDTIQCRMDFAMVVTYLGGASSEVFSADILGMAVMDPRPHPREEREIG
jgi:hypothetical protein